MGFSASSTFQAGDIGAIAERLRAGATAAVVATADHVLFMSSVLVPIDTGALQRSGNTSLEQMPEGPCAYVNYEEHYAGYVEFGTSRMRAQPYLRPALDGAHELLISNVKSELQDAL